MKKLFAGLTLAAMVMGGAGLAQDKPPFAMEIKARQGIMAYRALNLGRLGAMAKGEAEYNAEAAQAAADALAASAQLDESLLWPEGSDHSANPATTADAKLWDIETDYDGKHTEFVNAALAMQQAAGQGLDQLKAAMGPLGASCGSCHKATRIPN
ncbi:cytochrome c556 [Albidovulum inexpectatum]|uniref:Cytochrome c556 n=1 Tax=Albidovulum inexpectatum TaxID=196587 RepID=A0A2S5JIA7_9RHOB|nr:cytochrome c [Albidovulum inexpectatum]PPB81257.1 cytochrome c556 [Albidovulum inexpectatum]